MSRVPETPASPSHAKVLSASFLAKHNGKKDLVRRLETVARVFRTDDTVAPDCPHFPGLAALAASLVEDYLPYKDKEVRLYTVCCCMEIFAVYAPEAPWTNAEILEIFQQTIRQLGNLAHTKSSSPNFAMYQRILELLALVKIGVVLVDLAKNDGNAMDENEEQEQEDKPLEILAEVFQTTLQCLRPSHPQIIPEYVQQMISGCLEEYYGGVSIPIPLVEEILLAVQNGPILHVPNTAAPAPAPKQKGKKGKKGAQLAPAPITVEVENPSYKVASRIIRHNLDRLSSPIANLLNGLINGEAHIVDQSTLAAPEDEEGDEDVWEIIYQVGKISSSLLITVIGTVQNCLALEDANKRQKAVHLLGRLFCAKGSNLASKHGPCFRDWLHRSSDVEKDIRLFMVEKLIVLVKTNKDPAVVEESQKRLIKMIMEDPEKKIRLKAVEEVCDYGFLEKRSDPNLNPISIDLLRSVASRVQSKVPEERIKTLTGLGQIYFHVYMKDALCEIEAQGDNYDTDLISRALTENCSHSDIFANNNIDESPRSRGKYRFMASRIFQCFCYTDHTDAGMKSRLTSIVDELMLGSESSKAPSKRKLSPISRAVGLAVILDSLRQPGESVFEEHSTSNSFNFLTMFFRQRFALQKALGAYLDARSQIKEHPKNSQEAHDAEKEAMDLLLKVATFIPKPRGVNEDLSDIMHKFHHARDRRIFQLLGLITRPGHTRATKNRVLEDLPKRTQSLGDGVATWVEGLVKRCAMSAFMSSSVIEDSVRLANECLEKGDLTCASAFLATVDLATGVFPSICCHTESFEALKSMFSICVESVSKSPSKNNMKTHATKRSLCMVVTRVLSRAARAVVAANEKAEIDANDFLDKGIRKRLLQLCTAGKPQEAHNAVATLATLFTTPKDSTTEPLDGHVFTWLMKELTLPSKMNLNLEEEDPAQIVSTLSALKTLCELAPVFFARSSKGENSIKFAMEKVLQGRGSRGEASADEDNYNSTEEKTPKQKKKNRSAHQSPLSNLNALENDGLSVSCRRVIASIEFLVTYLQSTILATKNEAGGDDIYPSIERIKALFDILSQIILDQGLPPSERDRTHCQARQERAALRQCAAVQLFRLCAAKLNLEHKYLTTKMWHTLAGAVLDEERVVRDAVIGELTTMMNASGAFASKDPTQLRFLGLLCLCCDSGKNGADFSANGFAAVVGVRRIGAAKMAAERCFKRLRNAWQKAVDLEEDDESFENLKTQLMPENVVPFAFHLLAYRKETPVKEAPNDPDPTQKILKKRLKLLIEPLIQSLGDSPDNLSFLLSMNKLLSEGTPIDAGCTDSEFGSPDSSASKNSTPKEKPKSAPEAEPQARLRAVCAMARVVIHGCLKRDINLAPHPGEVKIPPSLFQRLKRSRKRSANYTTPQSTGSKPGRDDSNKKRVPGEVNLGLDSPGVSPIQKVASPGISTKSPELSDEEKTLSPGLTERTKASETTRPLCTQSTEASPQRGVETESQSTLVLQTQEESTGKRKRATKKGASVPSQIEMLDQEKSLSPIRHTASKRTKDSAEESKKKRRRKLPCSKSGRGSDDDSSSDELDESQKSTRSRNSNSTAKSTVANTGNSRSRPTSPRNRNSYGQENARPRKRGKRSNGEENDSPQSCTSPSKQSRTKQQTNVKPLKDSNRAPKANGSKEKKRASAPEPRRRSTRLR